MKAPLIALSFLAALPIARAETDSKALAEELGSLRNAKVAS